MKTLFYALTLLMTPLINTIHAEEREWYRINRYTLTSEEKAKDFDKAFTAILSILDQHDRGPIGVFTPVEKDDDDEDSKLVRYVISPLSNPTDILKTPELLHGHGDELLPALDYFTAEKDSPAFTRIESTLLYAFKGMPKLVIPGEPKEDSERLFELRTYESHSELKGKLKIEMFDDGELAIFKEVGLEPVFFGEAIAGSNLPNLTYMLVYDDDAHREKVWKAFLEAESWKALSADQRYADTVSKIISVFLKPTAYSGIR